MPLRDIETREDIEVLMKTFYGRLLHDPLMSPHFERTDFDYHLPRIVHFWAFILLNETGFTGSVFDAHRHLNIDDRHFERWIETFHQTVDTLFEGEKAAYAKQQASVIGFGFKSKMKYLKEHKN